MLIFNKEENLKSIKDQRIKDKFEELIKNVYYTEDAFRKLEILIQIDDKEEFKKFFH